MGTKWCSTQGCFPGPTNPSLNCWECQLRKAPNSIPHWNITSASGNDLTQCNAHSQEAAHNQWLANNGIQTSGSLASTGTTLKGRPTSRAPVGLAEASGATSLHISFSLCPILPSLPPYRLSPESTPELAFCTQLFIFKYVPREPNLR